MNKQYILECDYCHTSFEVNKSRFYESRYRHKTQAHKAFCSTVCRLSSRGASLKQTVTCAHCNKQCEKRVCEIKRTKNNFCSRTCSATYNNKRQPKRKAKLRECRSCNTIIGGAEYGQRVYCFECIKNKKHYRGIPLETKTIEDVIKRAGSNRYDGIRTHARALYKKELKNPCCESCGYTKHVELCHKQAISEFSKNTSILDVNHRNNVMFLCPNCHWEFDRTQRKRRKTQPAQS